MNAERILISSGVEWETVVGYSRAVRVGNVVEVAGTTALDGDTIVGKDDLYEQTRFVLQKIEKTLKEAGSGLEDIIRTRMFVTDISRWEEAGKAHGEFFRDIRPASTLVAVKSLIHPDLLIEIEATAILSVE